MAHDVTVLSQPGDWGPMYHAECAEGDLNTYPTQSHSEALDSATWHATQNDGQVYDPDWPPPTP
jgi:hypothetical protein